MKKVLIILSLIACCSLLYIFKSALFGVELYWIPSVSMQPTLNPGDVVIVRTKELTPSKGDIVVFTHEGLAQDFYIKRVIATESDKVVQQQSHLWVNGDLHTDRLNSQGQASWVLHSGQYFVLGDNANQSLDSRHFGPIEHGQIIGIYQKTLK